MSCQSGSGNHRQPKQAAKPKAKARPGVDEAPAVPVVLIDDDPGGEEEVMPAEEERLGRSESWPASVRRPAVSTRTRHFFFRRAFCVMLLFQIINVLWIRRKRKKMMISKSKRPSRMRNLRRRLLRLKQPWRAWSPPWPSCPAWPGGTVGRRRWQR